MTGNLQVVEDAAVDVREPARQQPPWLWMVLVFAVGLGAGAVFFGPVVSPTLDTIVSEPVTPLVPGEPIGPVGVALAIPGFPDAIVAIVDHQSGGAEYLLWPQAIGPTTRPLPMAAGRPAEIDASGVWVAMTQEVPDTAGDLLSVGRATGVSPATSGVSSFAWHDTANGALGFVRYHEGRWGLWRSPAFFNPQLMADLGDTGEPRLVAWGDWGWAIVHPGSSRVALLDPTGAVAASIDGLVIGSGPRGVLIYTGSGVSLVADDWSLRQLAMPQAALGTILAGAIAPDGSQVAVLTSTGLAVVSGVDGGVATWHGIGGSRGHPAWSSDSRFVMVPLARGARVLDTQTGEIVLVLEESAVRSLGIIPLSGSS